MVLSVVVAFIAITLSQTLWRSATFFYAYSSISVPSLKMTRNFPSRVTRTCSTVPYHNASSNSVISSCRCSVSK